MKFMVAALNQKQGVMSIDKCALLRMLPVWLRMYAASCIRYVFSVSLLHFFAIVSCDRAVFEEAFVQLIVKLRPYLFIALAVGAVLPVVTAPMALGAGIVFGLLSGNPLEGADLPLEPPVAAGGCDGSRFRCADSERHHHRSGCLCLYGSQYRPDHAAGPCAGQAVRHCLPHLNPDLVRHRHLRRQRHCRHGPGDQGRAGRDRGGAGHGLYPQCAGVAGLSTVGPSDGDGGRQFGLWSALAIHDTSSVVGAAAAFGGTGP